VYVAITAAWLLIVMALAIFLGARRRRLVLLLSFLQFPVHLYMALALRTANQGRLEGEDGNENRWDFGQTTAVLLLSIAVSELISKAREYVKFEKELKRKGLGTRQAGRSPDPPSSQMERDDEKNTHDESGGDGNGDVDNEGDDSEDGDVGGGLFEDDIRAIEAERHREEKYDGRSV
jgi:heme/copper-type cytochrome/quinol oxidase subunit 4